MLFDFEKILQVINFFFLALALLAVYYYAYRLQVELRRSEFLKKEAQKYQDLVNATTEGVLQFDEEGHFTILNQSGARCLGYEDPQEILNDSITVYHFLVDPDKKKQLCQIVKKNGELKNHIVQIKKKNGEVIYVSLSLHARVHGDGNPILYEGIFHDVTHQVVLEEELWNYSTRLEKLVQEKTDEILQLERKRFHLEKMAAIGQMAATLVHEIRSPMSSMKMALTLFQKKKEIFLEKERRVMELAVQECQRIEAMLKDVLDFARPQEIRLVAQDLHDVLDQVVERMKPAFQGKKIHFKKDWDSRMPLVLVDAERLLQVMVNLLQNAIDAVMPEKGEIQLRTQYIEKDGICRIETIDNGMGIPEEDLPKVFDPFFSKKPGGTGLGLSVVQKIVEAHRGRIQIESTVGEGTLVRIELPVESPKFHFQ